MKKWLYFVVLALLASSCVGDKTSGKDSIETITIDVDKAVRAFDISEFVDSTDFRIVPLETSQECVLSSKPGKFSYLRDRIYVLDKMSKGLYIFNVSDGSLYSKIQSVGQGPEEYVEITDMFVSDNNIFIYDQFGRKILIYDADGNYQSQINTRDIGVRGQTVFYFGGRIYLLDKYHSRDDKPGYFLCSMNMDGSGLQKHIAKIPEQGMIINHTLRCDYAFSDDSLMVMLTGSDTVYCVSGDEITPRYVLDFGDKKIPEKSRNMTFAEQEASGFTDLKYIRGANNIFCIGDFLVFDFMYGQVTPVTREEMQKQSFIPPTNKYYALYNMKTGETIVSNGIRISSFGMHNIGYTIVNGRIINYVDPYYATVGGYYEPKTDNQAYKERHKEVYSKLKSDDNPVVFVYKLNQ